MSYTFNGMTIPDHMMDALKRYTEHGQQPGGFLCAVITNDLKEACGKADDNNMRIIPAYVAWLYNEAPSGSWGTPEQFEAWTNAHLDSSAML